MFYNKENLNNAFKELRKLGYFARQNFKDCQKCAWGAVPVDKAKVVFYHSQDNADLLKYGECYLSWSGDADEIAAVLEKHGVLLKKPESEASRFLITIK